MPLADVACVRAVQQNQRQRTLASSSASMPVQSVRSIVEVGRQWLLQQAAGVAPGACLPPNDGTTRVPGLAQRCSVFCLSSFFLALSQAWNGKDLKNTNRIQFVCKNTPATAAMRGTCQTGMVAGICFAWHSGASRKWKCRGSVVDFEAPRRRTTRRWQGCGGLEEAEASRQSGWPGRGGVQEFRAHRQWSRRGSQGPGSGGARESGAARQWQRRGRQGAQDLEAPR